jgi:hypothetical protein
LPPSAECDALPLPLWCAGSSRGSPSLSQRGPRPWAASAVSWRPSLLVAAQRTAAGSTARCSARRRLPKLKLQGACARRASGRAGAWKRAECAPRPPVRCGDVRGCVGHGGNHDASPCRVCVLCSPPFPAPLDGKPRPRCYLDVSVGADAPKRVVVELAVSAVLSLALRPSLLPVCITTLRSCVCAE